MGKRRRRRREIPIAPEVHEALETQREAFRQKFGREPGPNDPVFFNPNADEPRPIPEDLLERETVEAMQRAGIRPELIHAYRRTGRLVTEENVKHLSKADLAEWQAAIEEYRALEARRN